MSVLKKIWNVATTLVVTLAVLMAVLLVGMRLLGFQVFSVLSGSMEPTYHTGAIIYVQEVDYRTLQPGDPITFMANETTVVTHRITAVTQDPDDPNTLWFTTKGDANKQEDASPVHWRNVIGKAVFSIPYLGYVSTYIQTPPGMYVAMGVCAVMLVAAFLPEKKKEEKTPETMG